jgi:hypothetical protein
LTSAQPENRLKDILASNAPIRPEPQLSWPPAASPQNTPAAPAAQEALPAAAPSAGFEADAPAAPSRFALPPQTAALLMRLSELLRRPDAPTPFAIGLFAKAGGGKSSALNWLRASISAPDGSPVAALKAVDLAAEPERALAAALFRALAPNFGPFANEAAHEGAHFGSDAGALARAAHEKLDLLRRKLLIERQNLAQTEARRAGLAESLLYDTPGSRVDAYARRIRAAFEPRLRRFGFSGDTLTGFKDFTRDLNETGSVQSRLVSAGKAVYAFPGQIRLLVYAVVCFGLSWGASWLSDNNTLWLNPINSSGAQGAQAGDYLQHHLDWLTQSAHVFSLLGLVLIGLNLWRAFSFMQPLFHAAGLLDEDVAAKRHELDQTLAHQARSVDLIGAETAAVAAKATDADRRAAAAGASKNPPLFLETDAATQKRDFSLGFLQTLSAAIEKGGPGAPRKLIVTVDGFEGVADPATLFDRLHDLLARPGFVAVYAINPGLFGTAPENLTRRIQLPLQLAAGRSEAATSLAPLDAPLTPVATQLLGALTPLAGDGPRLQKRLRNLFRFLRPAEDAPAGLSAALALFLAAQLGASADDRRSLNEALDGGGAGFAPFGSPVLKEALAAAGPIDRAQARQAAALARHVVG